MAHLLNDQMYKSGSKLNYQKQKENHINYKYLVMNIKDIIKPPSVTTFYFFYNFFTVIIKLVFWLSFMLIEFLSNIVINGYMI